MKEHPMDYNLPAPGLTLQQLLNGLINAAQELGEATYAGCTEAEEAAAQARVQTWRTAVEQLAAPVPLADPLTGHVITPNPVQTSVPGLTDAQAQDAYAEVTRRYALRAAACSKLDRATQYSAILIAATARDWKRVNRLLGHAGIIE